MPKKIPTHEGNTAILIWKNAVLARLETADAPLPVPEKNPDMTGHTKQIPPPAVPAEIIATAVRYSLQLLTATAPGRSVELRVPPYGAVQVVEGLTHRRGTPPAVIEMSADTWLRLASGNLSWDQALNTGMATASGERTDLSTYLPLL